MRWRTQFGGMALELRILASNLCQIKTILCQNYPNVSLHGIWFSADNLFVNSSFQRWIFRLFSSEICIIV